MPMTYLMLLARLTLPTRLVFFVGKCEFDISLFKGIRVHLWLMITICQCSAEVLVPPGKVHLNAFIRHFQMPFGC